MPLYPEYDLVQNFVDRTEELMATGRTMRDIFQYITKKNAFETAVMYRNERGRIIRYTYADLKSKCYSTASKLSKFLVLQPKSHIIALKLTTSRRWVEVFWAILMNGFKPLLIDPKQSEEGTKNLLAQSKAILIISDDEFNYDITKVSIEELFSMRQDYRFTTNWENEVIFCSSGTTGDIKLMLFNGDTLCNQILAAKKMPEISKEIIYPKKLGKLRILAMIPFHHIFGFIAVFLWYSFFGKTIVYVPSLAPNVVLELCRKVKITHIYSIPLFWDNVAQGAIRSADISGERTADTLNKVISYNTGKITKVQAGASAYPFTINYIKNTIFGTDVRFCITGGGYISDKTLNVINGLGYPLYNGYGMTELGVTSVELQSIVEDRLKGSIGRPLYGVTYKIIPEENNENVGELLVKSNFTHIREIIGGKEQMADLDKDGFFHTGDIALCDASGSYYIKGRIKDTIINANGDNIYPEEIEEAFKDIKNITNECVFGVKQKGTLDEKIILVLEVSNDVTEEEFKQIKASVKETNAKLPSAKQVDEFLLFYGKLPLANSLKVKRYVVKKMFENKDKGFISIEYKKDNVSFEGYPKDIINKILSRVRAIFSQILVLPQFKLTDEGHWINDFGGDSMSYIELVSTIDQEFKTSIPEEKYGQLVCINDFVREILEETKTKAK